MAILKTYNQRKHDIHTYLPEATRDPRVYGEQRGFNSECQGVAVDFSGVSLRPRGFTQVNDISGGYSILFDPDNINFWNTSNPCAVLISPKHAIICQHYRGRGRPIGENEVYTFLGKSGTRHSRRAIAVTDFSQQIDHSILEFESEFPTNDVRIYDVIADVSDIPEGRDMWVHDCQSRTYKMSMGVANYDSSGVSSYSSNPISSVAGLNEGPPSNGSSGTWPPYVWVGDSGSPTFVLTPQGNTIFVGLRNGGGQINEAEITLINEVLLSSSNHSVTHYGFTTGGGGGGSQCLGACFPGDLITFNDPSISSPFKSSLYPYIVETNSEIPSVNLTLQNYQRADNTNRFIMSRYSRDSAHTDWYLYYLYAISSTLGKIKKQSETTTRNPIVAVPAIRTHYKKDESQYYPNHYFTP